MQLLRARIEWGSAKVPVTSAGPGHEAAGAAVTANQHQRRRGRRSATVADTGAGSADSADSQPCKLDFREGCYQINFTPTASLVTFEGTLRVDRSAPDGGADNLIVSGDLYTRRPVIGPVVPPVTPVPPVARLTRTRTKHRAHRRP